MFLNTFSTKKSTAGRRPGRAILIFALSMLFCAFCIAEKKVNDSSAKTTVYSGLVGDEDIIHFTLAEHESALVIAKNSASNIQLTVTEHKPNSPHTILESGTYFRPGNLIPDTLFISGSDCTRCAIKISSQEGIDKLSRYQLKIEKLVALNSDQRTLYSLFNKAGADWLLSFQQSNLRDQYWLNIAGYLEEAAALAEQLNEIYWQRIALFRLAQIQHLQTRFEAQGKTLQRLQTISPQTDELYLKSLYFYAQYLNQYHNEPELEQAINRFKTHPMFAQSNREAAYVMALEAHLQVNKGQLKQGLEILLSANQKLQTTGDWHAILLNRLSMGWLENQLGNINQAKSIYHETLLLAQQFKGHRFAVDAATKLATIYRQQGRYHDALIYVNKALEKSKGFTETKLHGWALQEAGRIFAEHGQTDLAESHYLEAHAAFGLLKATADQINIEYFLTRLYFELEQFEKARHFGENVLSFDRHSGIPGEIARSLNHLAKIAMANGDTINSIHLRQEAKDYAKDIDNLYVKWEIKAGLVESFCAANKTIECQNHLQDLADSMSEHIPATIGVDSMLALAKGYLATANVKQAEKLLVSAQSEIQQHLNNIELLSAKQTFQAKQQRVSDLLLQLQYALKKSDEELITHSEKLRAQILLNQLHRLESSRVSNRDATERRALFARLHKQTSEYYLDSDSLSETDILKKIKYTTLALEQLDVQEHATKHAQGMTPNTLNIKALQRTLATNQAIFYFDTGPDTGFFWVLTREQLSLTRLPGDIFLKEAISELQNLINRPTGQRNKERTRLIAALSDTLFKGIRMDWHKITDLVIIPDDHLHALPFSLLHHPISGLPLVASHSITYAPSLAVFQAMNKPGFAVAENIQALVVADPSGSAHNNEQGDLIALRSIPKSPLPYARKEAGIIEKIPHLRSTVLLGEMATKHNVLQLPLPQYNIIHFAAHGIADQSHPALSGLVLAHTADKDHMLLAPEISGLRLNAGLIVLSACNSATGPLSKGEGLLGLSRAFQAAGASNVLASHWQVRDDVTALLIQHFYQNLFEQGLSIKAALRQAQYSIRNHKLPSGQSPWRDPYFWAGFTLYGQGTLTYDRTL